MTCKESETELRTVLTRRHHTSVQNMCEQHELLVKDAVGDIIFDLSLFEMSHCRVKNLNYFN